MIRDATATRFDFGPRAQGYDRWYETADGKAHDRQQKAAVVRVLPLPLVHDARLLDIGCGTGHWSRFFASLGFGVAGVDISLPMIEQTRARAGSRGPFGVADACSLPFGDDVFDVVAAMTVVEFVPDAEAVVAEMFRCVRKDGAVLIGTLNRLAPLNRNRVAAGKEPYASARLFSPTELRDLLGPYGTAHVSVTDPEDEGNEPGETGAFIVANTSR